MHVVHAAATVSKENEIVVIGSQSILGSHPSPPASMLRSMEADVYPLHAPEKADSIDVVLGDGSQFQSQFGYYAHGVGPETPKPPRGWQGRLIRVEVPERVASKVRAVAWCLEPHDLILAKLAANRSRDWEFARDAWVAGLLDADTLRRRAQDLPVPAELLRIVREGVEAMIAA
jgi:hypothetical protein